MFLSRFRKRAVAEARAQLGDEIVLMDDWANTLGLESKGWRQIRGNGCLALTADDILFVQWVPHRATRIPRAWITAVESPKAHLGKTYGRPLLRIRFTNELGQPDSIAWRVRDLHAWQAALS